MLIAPDFGKVALDYRKYRQGFPARFYQELKKREIGVSSQRVLDVGTGTGCIARELAKSGCYVRAIDPSVKLVDQAKLLDQEAEVKIDYFVTNVENSKQPSHFFDVVVAGQSWHWFDSSQAINEIKRIMKATGVLVIAYYDWIPLPGNVSSLTEKIVLKYNPDWKMSGGNGFYPQWVTQLASSNFKEIETFSFDVLAEFTNEAWCGRMRASAAIAAITSDEVVNRFNTEHVNELKKFFPVDI